MPCPTRSCSNEGATSPNVSTAEREHIRQHIRFLFCSHLVVQLASSYTTLLTNISNTEQPLPWVLNCFCFHPSFPSHPTISTPVSSYLCPSIFLKHKLCLPLLVSIRLSIAVYKGISPSRSTGPMGPHALRSSLFLFYFTSSNLLPHLG